MTFCKSDHQQRNLYDFSLIPIGKLLVKSISNYIWKQKMNVNYNFSPLPLLKCFHQKTQKLHFWWNSKTQVVMKLKNSNCDETQKLKLWWNSKTHIVIKLNNSNCDKTQKHKLWCNSNCDETKKLKLW